MMLILAGLIGLSSMTWLFPALAKLWLLVAKKAPVEPSSIRKVPSRIQKVEVLLPAHNEEGCISRTLENVERSLEFARKAWPNIVFSKTVGANGCKDRTVELVRAESKTTLLEDPSPNGKWKTLLRLVSHSQADWVILADVGVIWTEDFVANLIGNISDETIGLAPTYHPVPPGEREGLLERTHWALERFLKSIENASGGPVAVHGATVSYSKKELLEVMEKIPQLNWLNDDVVISLGMRLLNPGKKLVYLSTLGVYDQVDKKNVVKKTDQPQISFKAEVVRRNRMAHGNLQWIQLLMPTLFQRNPLVAILALRRVFRLLWAYWLLFCVLGFAELGDVYLGLPVFKALGVVGFLVLFQPLKPLFAGMLVSFQTPWRLLFTDPGQRVSWI